MSFHHPKSSLPSIMPADLDKVTGGSSRVSSKAGGSDEQLTLMLTQITDSIKGLAGQKNTGMDPMMMMVVMMMMGGGGGAGGAAPAAAAAPAPTPPPAPVINVAVKRNYY